MNRYRIVVNGNIICKDEFDYLRDAIMWVEDLITHGKYDKYHWSLFDIEIIELDEDDNAIDTVYNGMIRIPPKEFDIIPSRFFDVNGAEYYFLIRDEKENHGQIISIYCGDKVSEYPIFIDSDGQIIIDGMECNEVMDKIIEILEDEVKPEQR